MDPNPSNQPSGRRRLRRYLQWDFIEILFGLSIAALAVFFLDTGSVAQWISKHKESRLDEAIFAGILLLLCLSFFAFRRWMALSGRFLRSEGANRRHELPAAEELHRRHRRDLIGMLVAVGISIVLVFLFDTGSLAEWIAAHKETKVDEAIVAGAILLLGLGFFSLRRWIELSDQVAEYEELQRHTARLHREATLLSELSDMLQSCLSSEEAHRLVTDRAQILFPGSSGAVCLTSNSRDLVEVVAAWGDPALVEKFFPPKDCWALRRGRVQVLGEDQTVLGCAHLGQDRPDRALCVPMMAHGEALGLLYLDSGRENAQNASRNVASSFSESEQLLAKTLAEQTALALANLNLREILKAQSVRDPLTGLYNRRYMEESLDRELRRAVRKNVPLSVMMLDVDHFKRFNDTYGHEAGDMVLRLLGNLLLAQFRGEDVVCRYGGEEFTVILPEASLEAAMSRAEQLREAAKQSAAQVNGQSVERVTLSIGVATFPDNGSASDALLRAADLALYRAKQEGRDRVLGPTPTR